MHSLYIAVPHAMLCTSGRKRVRHALRLVIKECFEYEENRLSIRSAHAISAQQRHSFQVRSFSNVVDIIILRTGLQYKAMRCIYRHMLTLHGVPTRFAHCLFERKHASYRAGPLAS